jgi:hypothetical protein
MTPNSDLELLEIKREDKIEPKESVLIALAKCIAVGLGVGSVGIPLCFFGAILFYCLREFGIFALLVLIPVGAFSTWWATRKYLTQRSNRLRGAIAYGTRYFFLGAFLGFFLAGCACDVAYSTFLGGLIGFIIGSFGGAFQGWISSRRQVSS